MDNDRLVDVIPRPPVMVLPIVAAGISTAGFAVSAVVLTQAVEWPAALGAVVFGLFGLFAWRDVIHNARI